MSTSLSKTITWILLPGMDGTGDLFAPFIEAAGPSQPILVVRYPTDQALGYTELEAIARAALPTDRPYLLLGESFSGPIAISLAASKPAMLQGLVLCATFARNPQPLLKPFRALTRWAPIAATPPWFLEPALMGRFATPALRAAFRSALAKASANAMRTRAEAVLGVDVFDPLAAVDVPILYLRATQDRLVPLLCASEIVQHHRHCQVVEIEAPHFLLQTAPAEAKQAIETFAANVPGSSG